MSSLAVEAVAADHETDYMTDAQIEFFRMRLTAMLSEIQGRTRLKAIDNDEVMSAADPVDRAAFEDERTTIIANIERQDEMTHEIKAALRRIEEGDYGYCEETGEPIGLKRLQAYPTARLSIEAQSAMEARRRMRRIR